MGFFGFGRRWGLHGPGGQRGHLVGRHADQHLLSVYLDEENFLSRADGQAFNGLQTLGAFAQETGAALHFSEAPQHGQQQADDQSKAERVLQPVREGPSGVHGGL